MQQTRSLPVRCILVPDRVTQSVHRLLNPMPIVQTLGRVFLHSSILRKSKLLTRSRAHTQRNAASVIPESRLALLRIPDTG